MKESNNSLPFLDILMSRSENDFETSVYHKPAFSGVYSSFNSFIYDRHKIGLIFALLLRIFSVVSDFSSFHTEVSHLKNIIRKNAFDNCWLTIALKLFWIKFFCILPLHWLLRKKKNCLLLCHILVTYLFTVRTHLRNSINKNLLFRKVKVIFKSTTRLGKIFTF